jgi:starch phosphorylase
MMEKASHRERFEAVARSLRDLLTQRWLLTEQTYESANAKRVYYLSMEFLIGVQHDDHSCQLGPPAADHVDTARVSFCRLRQR